MGAHNLHHVSTTLPDGKMLARNGGLSTLSTLLCRTDWCPSILSCACKAEADMDPCQTLLPLSIGLSQTSTTSIVHTCQHYATSKHAMCEPSCKGTLFACPWMGSSVLGLDHALSIAQRYLRPPRVTWLASCPTTQHGAHPLTLQGDILAKANLCTSELYLGC